MTLTLEPMTVAIGAEIGGVDLADELSAEQAEPEIFVLPSGGTLKAPGVWHSDVTWRPEPSLGSILRAIELPPRGGDTLWADMGAAYGLLDDATKTQIDGLVALHNDFLPARRVMERVTVVGDRPV